MKLSHIRLLTNQFPVMFRFYRDAIGLRVRWGDENGVYADLDTGAGIDVAICSREIIEPMVQAAATTPREDSPDRAMLILAVDDVDYRANRLVEQGAVMVNPPADQPNHGIRSAHLRDPDGNLIEVNCEIPESRWSETLRELNRTVNWDEPSPR